MNASNNDYWVSSAFRSLTPSFVRVCVCVCVCVCQKGCLRVWFGTSSMSMTNTRRGRVGMQLLVYRIVIIAMHHSLITASRDHSDRLVNIHYYVLA